MFLLADGGLPLQLVVVHTAEEMAAATAVLLGSTAAELGAGSLPAGQLQVLQAAHLVELAGGPAPVQPHPGPRPSGVSHVIFTSGSTGVPKAVVCPHRALASYALANAAAHCVGCSSRVLVVSHLGGAH